SDALIPPSTCTPARSPPAHRRAPQLEQQACAWVRLGRRPLVVRLAAARADVVARAGGEEAVDCERRGRDEHRRDDRLPRPEDRPRLDGGTAGNDAAEPARRAAARSAAALGQPRRTP